MNRRGARHRARLAGLKCADNHFLRASTRGLECRHGVARAQRCREHKKQNTQTPQSDEASKGLEQGGHVSDV